MKSYKARGIVLNTVKYGDSSMVAQLLTDVGGRCSYMVQGVRSSRGRGSKAALLQPMFTVEFEGLESSKMDMHRFRELRSGIVLQSIPFDVRKSTIALFMAEVLYRLVRESEPNEALFNFVWGSVEALDALSLAQQAGSAKAVNIVLMGRAAKYFGIPYERWIAAIENTVAPKFVEMNKIAFDLGYHA